MSAAAAVNMEVYNRIVQCSQPKSQNKLDCKATQNSSKQVNEVQVRLELGHTAALRHRPTAEGFTHDWVVYVRGPEGRNIQHFVEKVEFHLHETFPRPRRVVREPPFQVSESGYGGFVMPIDVYLRNNGEPKKIRFVYELFLGVTKSVSHSRCEKISFRNPSELFHSRLIRGGGFTEECSQSPSASLDSDSSSVLAISDHPEEQYTHRSNPRPLDKLRCVIGPVKDMRNAVADPTEPKSDIDSIVRCLEKPSSNNMKPRIHSSSHKNISSPVRPRFLANDICQSSIANLDEKRKMTEEIKRIKIAEIDRQIKLSNFADNDDEDDVCIIGCTWSNQLRRKQPNSDPVVTSRVSSNGFVQLGSEDRISASKNNEKYFQCSDGVEESARNRPRSTVRINYHAAQSHENLPVSTNSISSNAVATNFATTTTLMSTSQHHKAATTTSLSDTRVNLYASSVKPPTTASAESSTFLPSIAAVPPVHFLASTQPASSTTNVHRPEEGSAGCGFIHVIQPSHLKEDAEPTAGQVNLVSEQCRRGRKKKPVLVEPNFEVVKRKPGRPRKMPIESANRNANDALKIPATRNIDSIDSKNFLPPSQFNRPLEPNPNKEDNNAGAAAAASDPLLSKGDESILRCHKDDLNSLSDADIVDFDSFSRDVGSISAPTSTPIKENQTLNCKKPKLRIRFKPFVEQFNYDEDAEIVLSADARASINRHASFAPAYAHTAISRPETNLADNLPAQKVSRHETLASVENIPRTGCHQSTMRSVNVLPHSSHPHSSKTAVPLSDNRLSSRPETAVRMFLKPSNGHSDPNEQLQNTQSSSSNRSGTNAITKDFQRSETLIQSSGNQITSSNSHISRLNSSKQTQQIPHHDHQNIKEENDSIRPPITTKSTEKIQIPISSKVRKELSFGMKRKVDHEEDEDKENQPKRPRYSTTTKSNYDLTTAVRGETEATQKRSIPINGGDHPAKPVRLDQTAVVAPSNNALILSLFELQKRLMSIADMTVLRKVVQIIEETGNYRVNEATFDFDLCNLDPQTVKKLQRCLTAVSA